MNAQAFRATGFEPPCRVGFLRILLVGIVLNAGCSVSAQFAAVRPGVLNSTAHSDTGGDFVPHLATDGLGNWVAVWSSAENLNGAAGTDSDIFYARSNDHGATWSSPQLLNTNGNGDTGSDQSPRVASDRLGRWIAVWQSRENLGGYLGTEGDILYAVSSDGGVTWSAPKALNSQAVGDFHEDVAPTIEIGRAGIWIVAWHGGHPGGGQNDREILYSRSMNGGDTWTPAIPLNSNAGGDEGHDFNVSLATDRAGRWMAVWSSTDDLPGIQDGDSDIVFSRSMDEGLTWSAPAFVRSAAMTDKLEDFNAQVRTDGQGSWLIVWESGDDLGGTIGTDQDILIARSNDNGASWSAAAALNANAAVDRALDSFPSLTTDGSGMWVCTWTAGEDNLQGQGGQDRDILSAYSLDAGRTWSAPVAFASNAALDAGDDQASQVVADRSGHWIVVWQSNENLFGKTGADGDILFGTLTNPLFWSFPVVFNSDAATDQRSDSALRLASDGRGTWIAVWAGAKTNSSDMLFSRSADNGLTWSVPALFRPTAINVGGRDPRIATDRHGTWVVVWAKDGDILSVRSSDQGLTWSAPVSLSAGEAGDSDFSPSLVTDGGGNWILAWGTVRPSLGGDFDVMSVSSTDNAVTWSAPAPLKTNAMNDTGDDFDPQVATDGQGQWIAVWMSNDPMNNTIGQDDDILWAHSPDNGIHWSPAVPFNTNAATDGADDDDYTPQIITDGRGNWLVAWHSESTLGQTIGADYDILYMRSTDQGLTWSTVAPLNTNASVDKGDDRYLELSANAAGEFLAVWVSDEPSLGGERSSAGGTSESDIIVARSVNAGANWSAPAALNPNATLDSNSELTPSLAAGAGGKWMAGQLVSDSRSGGDPEPAFYLALQPGSTSMGGSGLRISHANMSGGNLTMSWIGGAPPFVVQTRSSLGSSLTWVSLLTTCNRTATVPLSGSAAFYRVVSVSETGPSLAWASETRFLLPTGSTAVAESIYVDGFGIDAEVNVLSSGTLPLVVQRDVVNPTGYPLAGGYVASIEVQGMTFVAAAGVAGYTPGTAAQIAFSCQTTNTPALQPGQSGTIEFVLGGPDCPPAIPLAMLPCGLYQVNAEVTVPVAGACSGLNSTFTLAHQDYIFVPSTNRLNMQVVLNPTNIRAPAGPPFPNVLICVQSRVGVLTDPAAGMGGFETARTHQVNITTFPNPNASYFVRARHPVMGNKGIGTSATLVPAISQSPAPPSLFSGPTTISCDLTAPEGYHGRRGCNGGCGGIPVFQDKIDITITAIATDGCSIQSRRLRGAAIYECDFLKFEFP